MNYVLSLIALLTVASCNVSKNSESKKCTFNGEPVECSKESNGVSDGTDESLEPFTLISEVSADILISFNEIEILENTEDVATETRNGNEYECSSGTESGQTYVYKLSGNTLGLFIGNAVETYTRVSGEGNNIQGSWKNVQRDGMGLTTTTLVFTDDEMEVKVKCEFN